MSDRQVRIIISANVADALRGLASVQGGLRNVGSAGQSAQRETESFGDKLKKAAAAAGIVTGFAAVTGAITSVIRTGVSFENNMNSLQAVTRATDAQMAALSGRARELGSDIDLPATSASDAAEAMLELSKGGLNVEQSMAAAKGSLLLAAAASITGAQAAEIQVNALNMFRLSADNANMVADVLANSANAASGEITDMAQALAMSGTTANSFGIDIDDTATVLALFAKNGQIGSTAGTTFNTMLSMMANPSKQAAEAMDTLNLTLFDSNGQFVGARSLTEQLATARGKLTQAEFAQAAAAAFGQDAQKGANILATEGAAAYDDMNQKVTEVAGAQTFAAAQTQGVSGAFGKMMSAVEDVSVTLFDKFAPAMEGGLGLAAGMVGAIGGLVGFFGDLPAPIQAGAAALTALIVLKGPLLALWTAAKATGVGLAIQGEMLAARLAMQSLRLQAAATGTSMGAMGAAMRVAGVAAVGLGNSLKAAFLSNPIGLAIVAATTALTFFMTSSDEATAATEGLTGAIDAQTGALTENAAQQLSDAAAKSGASQAYKNLGGDVADYVDAMGGIPGAQEKVNAVIDAAREAYNKKQDAVAAATTGTGNFGVALDGVGPSIQDVNTAVEFLAAADGTLDGKQKEVALSAEGVSGALGAAGGAAEGAAPQVDALGDALKKASENASLMASTTEGAAQLAAVSAAASDAARALDLFKIAQDNADGRVRSLDEATANQNKTLRALEESLKAGTAAATENTEAGDLNVEALRNWDVAALTATDSGSKVFDEMTRMADQYSETTEAAYSNAVATGNVAGAADVARGAATQSRAAFVALMTQHLGSEEQAQALADKLGILDGQKIDNKVFDTINEDAEAQRKLREAQAAEIQNKRFSVIAEDRATAVVNAINAMPVFNKSFTVTETRAVVMGNTVVAGGNTAGGFSNNEDGGVVHAAMGRIVGGRGNSMVRDGSGPGLTWAEAATNKEYYLSMKAGMESRNRMLAAAAVRDLGGQAVFGERQITPVMPAQQPVYARPGGQSGAGGAGKTVNVNVGQVGYMEDVRHATNMALLTADF